MYITCAFIHVVFIFSFILYVFIITIIYLCFHLRNKFFPWIRMLREKRIVAQPLCWQHPTTGTYHKVNKFGPKPPTSFLQGHLDSYS